MKQCARVQNSPRPLISASLSPLSQFFRNFSLVRLCLLLALVFVLAPSALPALAYPEEAVNYGETVTGRIVSSNWPGNYCYALSCDLEFPFFGDAGDKVKAELTISGGIVGGGGMRAYIWDGWYYNQSPYAQWTDLSDGGKHFSVTWVLESDPGRREYQFRARFVMEDNRRSRYELPNRRYKFKVTLQSSGNDGSTGVSTTTRSTTSRGPAAPSENEINVHGYCVRMPYGLETVAIKKRGAGHCPTIGNGTLCAKPLLDIVDIDGYTEQGIDFCFPQRGAVWFLPKQTASGGAVDQRSYPPERLSCWYEGNKTFFRVPRPGYFALENAGGCSGGGGGSTSRVSAPAPLVCNLDAKLRRGDRAERSGQTGINLRNAPGLNGTRVGKIQPGTVVSVLEGPRSANGYQWYKIRTAGRAEGWVAESGNIGGKCGYFFVKTSKPVQDPGGQRIDGPLTVNSRCSLHDAITAANTDRGAGGCPPGNGADTIKLGVNITVTRGLPDITSDITIDGNNRAINGGHKHRIFIVNEGGKLTLKRLTLRNARSGTDGAALHNRGRAVLNNVNFSGNHSVKDGGAVSNHGTMSIGGGHFTSNESAESGGAIRNKGSLTINNTTFGSNTSGDKGGAIRNKGKLTVTSATFRNNSSKAKGGGISNAGTATVRSSNFISNTAACVGGAIEHKGGEFALRTSNFETNSAPTCDGVDCGSRTALDATRISYGVLTKGELGCSSDYDLYSFEGKRGDTVKIAMTRHRGDIAPAISLWNRMGTKLAEDANSSTERDALIANYKLPSSGAFTISANNFHDGGGSYYIELKNEVTYRLPEDNAKQIAEDTRGFYTDGQLKKAEKTIKKYAIMACDLAAPLLASGKSAAISIADEVLQGVVQELVKAGAISFAEYSADELRDMRDNGKVVGEFPELLEEMAAVLELIPTGPCSALVATEAALDYFVGDVLLGIKQGTTDLPDESCKLSSSGTVLAHNWPSGEGSVIGQVFAKDGIAPVGTVQLAGQPRFYMLTGKFGGKTPLVGAERTAVWGSADDHGAAFLHPDYVTATDGCGSLPDFTPLLSHISQPEAGEHANPYAINALNPESGDCDIVVDGKIRLYETWGDAWTLSDHIDEYTAHPVDSFTITKFTQFPGTARGSVYVKDNGNPDREGWLVSRGSWASGTDISWHDDSDFKNCLPGLPSDFWG